MKNKKIAILSPHLDDVVISCGDHALAWKKNNKVTVISIFTSYSGRLRPLYSEQLLAKLRMSVRNYEEQRAKEDKTAMEILGLEWEHWGMVDGGFREVGNVPIYSTVEELFAGNISQKDKGLVAFLSQKIQKVAKDYDVFVCPMGIGNHVDHLIVKKSLMQVVGSSKVFFYFDAPYFFKPGMWFKSFCLFVRFLPNVSIIWLSQIKLRALQNYISQFRLLFKRKPLYPEIMVMR